MEREHFYSIVRQYGASLLSPQEGRQVLDAAEAERLSEEHRQQIAEILLMGRKRSANAPGERHSDPELTDADFQRMLNPTDGWSDDHLQLIAGILRIENAEDASSVQQERSSAISQAQKLIEIIAESKVTISQDGATRQSSQREQQIVQRRVNALIKLIRLIREHNITLEMCGSNTADLAAKTQDLVYFLPRQIPAPSSGIVGYDLHRYMETRSKMLDALQRKVQILRKQPTSMNDALMVFEIEFMIELLPAQLNEQTNHLFEAVEEKIRQLQSTDLRRELMRWFQNYIRCEPDLDRVRTLCRG